MRFQSVTTVLMAALAGPVSGQPRSRELQYRVDALTDRSQVIAHRATAAPPQGWNADDPADSLYRAARSALNRRSYTQAAYLFSQIYSRHPKSAYTGDAYY